MLKGIKVKIYPTTSQKVYINDLLGSCRFVYNQTLQHKISAYVQEEKSLSLKDLGNFFHQDLTKREDLVWLTYHNTHVLKQEIINLLDAYKRFFVNGAGFPKFKSKKDIQSCRFPVTAISKKMITCGKINLVKQLKGLKFRCSDNYKKIIYENIGKIKSATLSKDKAGNFYLSFLIDCINPDLPKPIHESVGLDFGISTYITTSRADEIANLRSTRSNEKKLKRLNQNLSRKEKGSRNKEKARLKLAKAHKKIANRKLTYIHTTTKRLVRENQVVGIEDLNVGGMMKNHRLARSIQEVSLYETKRQLEYKSRFYGRTLVKVDRFYPSSKLCSGCENKKDKLKLSERVYKCVKCGLVIGRDLNAALNIEKEALRIIKIGNCNPESKPVDSALMDGSEKSLKKSTMYEAGKVK